MSPEQFDALINLVDHKIATALKYGKFTSQTLKSKEGRVRALLTSTTESALQPVAEPKTLSRSDLAATLDRLLQQRTNIEMADDRAHSNGRLRAIDAEIAAVRRDIATIDNSTKC